MYQYKRSWVRRLGAPLLLLALLVWPCAGVGAQDVAEVFLLPEEVRVPIDQAVGVTIQVRDAVGLYAAQIAMQFDPSVIEIVDLQPGPLLQNGTPMGEVDNEGGSVIYSLTLPEAAAAVNGSGPLVKFNVRGKGEGSSVLVLEVMLSDAAGDELPARVQHGVVDVGNFPMPSPTPPDAPPASPAPLQPTPTPRPRPAAQTPAPNAPTQAPPAGATQAPAAPAAGATQPPAAPAVAATPAPADRPTLKQIVNEGRLPNWLFLAGFVILLFLIGVATVVILAGLYGAMRRR